MRRISWILVLGLLSGCGDDSGGGDSGPGTDAGPGVDAGPPVCGDMRVTPPEECDDGNTMAGDGCDAQCRRETPVTCGNGTVDPGEECDDGNTTSSDGCDDACLVEVSPGGCGDGALVPADGEECDDGNTTDGDGCNARCQLETVGAFCGNSTIDGLENCDDGNVANGDMCNSTCNFQNQMTLFMGQVGVNGSMDGPLGTATIGGMTCTCGEGSGALAADNTYLWVGDSNSRTLRRIDLTAGTPMLTTFAGNGQQMVTDGTGTASASFGGLGSITTDGRTVWVGDACRIRAVDIATAVVTTVGGVGPCGTPNSFNGPAVGAAAVPANTVQFHDLRGLTYYAGHVYAVESEADVLVRFDPVAGTIETLAGTAYMRGHVDAVGAAGRFMSPRNIASDNSGLLFIGDNLGYAIRTYSIATGAVGTLAGDGTTGYVDAVGTAARIDRPRGITSDGTSVYFVEFEEDTVRQVEIATGSVTTMIGTRNADAHLPGTGTAAQLNGPWAVAFHYPSNSLFVLDAGSRVITRIQ